VVQQRGGVSGWNFLDLFEVFFDAGLLEAGLGEVLGGADEGSRAAFDGGAEGAEIAAGFWSEEQDRLLSLSRHGDEDALVADVSLPGFDAGEPVVRRRIRRAAKERDD
jgi:hypothetical protein